jgi:hypothetical protein
MIYFKWKACRGGKGGNDNAYLAGLRFPSLQNLDDDLVFIAGAEFVLQCQL